MFGPRAAAVHRRLQEALCAAQPDQDDGGGGGGGGGAGPAALAAISAQMGLVAQLRHIASELKARTTAFPL